MPTQRRFVVQGSTLHRWAVQDGIYSAAALVQRPIGTASIQAAQDWVLVPSGPSMRDAIHASDQAWDASILDFRAHKAKPARETYGDRYVSYASCSAANAARATKACDVEDAAYAAADAANALTVAADVTDTHDSQHYWNALNIGRKRLLFLQMLSDADILPEPTAAAIQNRGSRGLYRL